MKKTLLRRQFEEITARERYTKPVIVAYGLMNSGKSSLLNMLTGNVEQEFFKTNDIRETVENKEFESGNYVYLDTPGLDADDQDDVHAKSGVDQADVVLFVHQPQGELEASEVNFLRKLTLSFGEYATQHIVIVLTKMEKEEAEKIDLIEQRIRHQCEAEIGFPPTIFQVSNKRYQTGVLKGQQTLITLSYMPELMTYLERLAYTATAPRVRRTLGEITVLQRAVEKAEQNMRSEKSRLRSQISHGFLSFNQQVEQLHTFLDASASDFKRI